MKTFLASVILLLVGSCIAQAATLEEALEATCKVKSGGSVGSGCAFEIVNDEVRILTNFHVAEGRRDLLVEFWKDGYKSIPLPAASTWWSYIEADSRDMCVISVPLWAFGNTPPPVVPLAPRGTQVHRGQTIYSAGCDDAQDPKLWKGHITEANNRNSVRFEPSSIPGQSGSSLFAKNADGMLEVVGLIAWKDPIGRYGIAMTIATIYESMDQNLTGVFASYTDDRPLVRVEKKNYYPDERKPQKTASHCVHGVSTSVWCAQCADEIQCPGGQCPPSQYRRGFGFGWGGQAPQPQQPYYQQPYQAPQQPYGNPYPANPGYTPADPRSNGGAAGTYVTRNEMDRLGTAIDDKLEATRKEILDRQEAIRVEQSQRLSGLENLADQVKDIPAVREAAQEALDELAATQANLKKVDERIDAETENLEKKTHDAVGDVTERIEQTEKSLLDRLKDKVGSVDIGSLRAEIAKNREEGQSLKESVLEALRTRITERIVNDDGGGLSGITHSPLAAALSIGGPVGIGIGVAGYFLKRRIKRRLVAVATPTTTTVLNPR